MHPEKFHVFQTLISGISRMLHALFPWSLEHTPESRNPVAAEIAESVTRDSKFQSYVARSGPHWLPSFILQEAGRA